MRSAFPASGAGSAPSEPAFVPLSASLQDEPAVGRVASDVASGEPGMSAPVKNTFIHFSSFDDDDEQPDYRPSKSGPAHMTFHHRTEPAFEPLATTVEEEVVRDDETPLSTADGKADANEYLLPPGLTVPSGLVSGDQPRNGMEAPAFVPVAVTPPPPAEESEQPQAPTDGDGDGPGAPRPGESLGLLRAPQASPVVVKNTFIHFED
eukprot:CAMPEP_0195143524 /NCGR_PEP_ID=MMETSP0448-20130528/166494_1 /TAXON_ID=66468 /ORGANISM="Heterocapsa triquestra, Strain CCMP 448" /LENGTH=206 /DNA_ID=CAMNT_0040181959 /DNA_START=85 /DNA_END=702 /DNA_ORIENTATION=+